MIADTIAAIATPPGVGGVGIVRVSGPAAERVLHAVCPDFEPATASHTLVHVRAISPADGTLLDHVLAVLMKGPRSYTGEDVAELHGHGGTVNMRRLLSATLSAGARPAEPGEFSKRAFLNGRLDLTQVEAVADIIDAGSRAALDMAQDNLQGALGRAVGQLQGQLADAIVLTESTIDFSQEEDLYALDRPDLRRRVGSVLDQVDTLLNTYEAGRQIREGLVVVIVGRPNSGKSTLFNALCGLDRAIVTPVPGTTRDFLEERVLLDGVLLRLTDTAGLRDTEDPVEALGVTRALERARRADILLWLHDGNDPAPVAESDCQTIAALGAERVAVVNKSDLPQRMSVADRARLGTSTGRPVVSTSLERGDGLDALRAVLSEVVRERLRPAGEGVAICRERHRAGLIMARESLRRALGGLDAELGEELLAADLRESLEAIGRIVGSQITSSDVLNRIFGEFCVGK